MDIFNYIAWFVAISGLAFFLYTRKEDYSPQCIEGYWKLLRRIKADGLEENCDSVFINLENNNFSYITTANDSEKRIQTGIYKENNKILTITIDNSVNLFDLENNFEKEEDGRNVKWIFKIKECNQSILNVEYNNELLLFRKY